MPEKFNYKKWVKIEHDLGFWIVFIHAMSMFVTGQHVSPEEVGVLYALLTYSGGKLVANNAPGWISSFRGGSESVVQTQTQQVSTTSVSVNDRVGMPDFPRPR